MVEKLDVLTVALSADHSAAERASQKVVMMDELMVGLLVGSMAVSLV